MVIVPAQLGVVELGIVLLQHHLPLFFGETAFLEPLLHLDRAKARLREVDAHDRPEAAPVELPEEEGRGR